MVQDVAAVTSPHTNEVAVKGKVKVTVKEEATRGHHSPPVATAAVVSSLPAVIALCCTNSHKVENRVLLMSFSQC